jgi:hypothetical protein
MKVVFEPDMLDGTGITLVTVTVIFFGWVGWWCWIYTGVAV